MRTCPALGPATAAVHCFLSFSGNLCKYAQGLIPNTDQRSQTHLASGHTRAHAHPTQRCKLFSKHLHKHGCVGVPWHNEKQSKYLHTNKSEPMTTMTTLKAAARVELFCSYNKKHCEQKMFIIFMTACGATYSSHFGVAFVYTAAHVKSNKFNNAWWDLKPLADARTRKRKIKAAMG